MTRTQWRDRLVLAALAQIAAGLAVVWGLSPTAGMRAGLYAALAVALESSVRAAGSALGPRARPARPRAPAASRDQPEFAAVAAGPEPPPVVLPDRLQELQRAVWLGAQSIGGWYFRLRPLLRDTADGLLHDRHGVRLDRDPVAAQALLGPRAWELLRPDVAPPDDRWAAGPPADELEELVKRIEEL